MPICSEKPMPDSQSCVPLTIPPHKFQQTEARLIDLRGFGEMHSTIAQIPHENKQNHDTVLLSYYVIEQYRTIAP